MSRPSPSAALWLLVALLVAHAAPAPAAPKNLLLNPGFEESRPDHPWAPAGWDTSRSGLSTSFFGRDTLLAHEGRYAVSVASVSNVIPLAHVWTQNVLVGREAWGKDAVLTIWTRSNGLDGRGYILLQAYRDSITKMAMTWGMERQAAADRLGIKILDDPLLDLGWARETFTENETGWVRRQVRVYIPPSTNVLIVRAGLLGTGQVLVDDASLVLEKAAPARVPGPGVNLMADPGFELGGNAWEFAPVPFELSSVGVDTTEAHSGRASARCESPVQLFVTGRSGVAQVFSNRALQGKRIRLSAWVKTDSLKESAAYVMLFAHGVSGSTKVPQPQNFGRTTPWTLTSIEMDVPRDAYNVWAWLAYSAPSKGVVHWDDAVLEVLGPAGTKSTAKP